MNDFADLPSYLERQPIAARLPLQAPDTTGPIVPWPPLERTAKPPGASLLWLLVAALIVGLLLYLALVAARSVAR